MSTNFFEKIFFKTFFLRNKLDFRICILKMMLRIIFFCCISLRAVSPQSVRVYMFTDRGSCKIL